MIWMNGLYVEDDSVDSFDDQSIYEVIRLIDHTPVFFDLHMDRLFQSLQAKKWNTVYKRYDFYSAIIKIANKSECNVRIEISKNDDGLMHRVFNVPFSYPTEEEYENGVKVITRQVTRPDPHVKMYRSQYANQINAYRQATGAFEVLLSNELGLVTEGSRSNVFFIEGETVITPKADDVLLGISRTVLMKIIKDHSISFIERDVYLNEIERFTSVFLTGTSLHLLPVSSVGDHRVKNGGAQLIHELLHLFKMEVSRDIIHTRRKYTMLSVKERFLKYIQFNTISDPDSETCPSTMSQKELGQYILQEMIDIGLSNVQMDENGYVYGEIPAHSECQNAPVLGFIAHMDTSPDLSGENIKANVVENYQGGAILLNKTLDIWLKPEEFNHLNHYVGQDLIVTDGTTLLGADNKAGIAEIMTMAQIVLQNPDLPHGKIKIGFTPDEEIGRGADRFNIKAFGADFAYTVDGGELGEIEYENFNAATAKVKVNGVNIHPGSAKGKMKNAILIGMEFNALLPALEVPHNTEHYEGFSHLNDMSGSVENADLLYIIRDHDLVKFEKKKEMFKSVEAFLNTKYGENTVSVDIKDSYYNMKEKILPHFHLIENAISVMESLGIKPLIVPVRGGTDGARLSYMGLPCPNVCTGGHNFHGRFEYIPVQSMEKTVEILVGLVESYSRYNNK